MGRKSSIEQLDPRIREEVDRLIREDQRTLEEILEHLQSLGAKASRSALGRYAKNARDQMERYREAQQVAKVWVDKLETEPQGDVARLLPEMLRAIAFQTMSQMSEREEAIDAGEIMYLARALKDVGSASKSNVDIELKLREVRAALEAQKADAAAKADKLAAKGGLTPEHAAQIRALILGINVDG